MPDADDAVIAAVAAQKKLAGARLVRKQELEAELEKLRVDRDVVAAEPAADALREELDKSIQAVTGELATVVAELRAALAEIAELSKLAAKSRAPAILPDDPMLQSAEDIALENARGHIKDLDALAGIGERPAPSEAPPAPSAPEDADAKARAAFDELRGRRDKPPKKTF
jgi:uncharacterized NAD-dependent epimerase/dehydratase family protein